MNVKLYSTALVLALSILAVSKERPDERLRAVTSVFVAGNNQAAEGARQTLRENRTCLTLSPKAEDADAVLEVAADAQTMGGPLGSMGSRTWIVSGTLTLRTKDQVWSRSERLMDSPLKSGAKTAGDLLVKHLAADAGCRERAKAPR